MNMLLVPVALICSGAEVAFMRQTDEKTSLVVLKTQKLCGDEMKL